MELFCSQFTTTAFKNVSEATYICVCSSLKDILKIINFLYLILTDCTDLKILKNKGRVEINTNYAAHDKSRSLSNLTSVTFSLLKK